MTSIAALKAKARATGRLKIGRAILRETIAAAERAPSSKTRARFCLRTHEIEAVIKARHGSVVPDATGTDDMEMVAGYLLAAAGSGMEPIGFRGRFMPWLEIRSREMAAARRLFARTQPTAKKPVFLSADDVARHMAVSMAERDALGLRTIGACDVPAEERKRLAADRKRQRDRDRQRAKRESGKTRAEYLECSKQSTKPWEQEGVSRRTWYRKYAVAQVVANTLIENSTRDGLVPTGETASSIDAQVSEGSQTADTKIQPKPKAESRGLGTSPQRVPRRAEPCVIARAAS